ncbi:MAG: YceI family protein [Acidobacteriota bacterium]|nr:YceI family protein [Acidobacteriota bacterium]
MSIYQIDTAHSSAQFKVRHMMIANVKGEFDKVNGTVNFDPANPSASTVEASIDVSTISTRDEQRDSHLKSADFLDVQKYPTITFKSKKVTSTGSDSFQVAGDLTIRDITKEVTLTVEELTGEAKDPWGNMRRGATAKARLNRKDFGMSFNVALEAGGFLVGEEVDLTIDVELIRQA